MFNAIKVLREGADAFTEATGKLSGLEPWFYLPDAYPATDLTKYNASIQKFNIFTDEFYAEDSQRQNNEEMYNALEMMREAAAAYTKATGEESGLQPYFFSPDAYPEGE
jgi:hypothetical protein